MEIKKQDEKAAIISDVFISDHTGCQCTTALAENQ
jgi:hypothetical protein